MRLHLYFRSSLRPFFCFSPAAIQSSSSLFACFLDTASRGFDYVYRRCCCPDTHLQGPTHVVPFLGIPVACRAHSRTTTLVCRRSSPFLGP